MPAEQPITLMLHELASGDKSALDRLMPLIYAELRSLAGRYLRQERPGNTLQPTALVNEAYLRLVAQDQPDYRNRSHFLGVAAHLMRQILIDHVRARNAGKRGGGEAVYSFDEILDAPVEQPLAVMALEDALQ